MNEGSLEGVKDLPIRMLSDRILVLPDVETERRSKSGILIPANINISKRLSWAKVVAAGSNVRQLKLGDKVLYDPADRLEVELEAAIYVLLRERDVHGVLEEGLEPEAGGLYL